MAQAVFPSLPVVHIQLRLAWLTSASAVPGLHVLHLCCVGPALSCLHPEGVAPPFARERLAGLSALLCLQDCV